MSDKFTYKFIYMLPCMINIIIAQLGAPPCEIQMKCVFQ